MITDPDQLRELARWRTEDFLESEEDYSDYRSDSRIGVIGACGRSGTTILRHILGTHSQIADSPESYLFLPVPIDIVDLSARFKLNPDKVRHLYDVSTSRSEFIDHFQQFYLSVRQRSLWVDKTSRNVHRFERILYHFPQARLIHVIRDPRDTICSLRTHTRIRRGDPLHRPTGWLQPWEECVDRWLRSIKDGLKLRGSPNYLEVRYEDLIQEMKTTLQRICSFLNVKYEPRMLDYSVRLGPMPDLTYIPNNERATKPLTRDRIGVWKTEIPADKLDMILRAVGPYLECLGYEP